MSDKGREGGRYRGIKVTVYTLMIFMTIFKNFFIKESKQYEVLV